MSYDDDALYRGARMFDAHPDSIAAQLARRDGGGIYSDELHAIIDSPHDRRTALRLSVDPRGVEKHVYASNDGAGSSIGMPAGRGRRSSTPPPATCSARDPPCDADAWRGAISG